MKEYIINSPQLQSIHKRIGALLVWAVCWLMWVYLLIPLLTLCAWLLGDNSLSNEIRWFGGYKSLLELLEIYFDTLLILVSLWLVWVVYHALRRQTLIPAALKKLDDVAICTFYQVDAQKLAECRKASLVTVYFDEHGHITHLHSNQVATGSGLTAPLE